MSPMFKNNCKIFNLFKSTKFLFNPNNKIEEQRDKQYADERCSYHPANNGCTDDMSAC